MIPNRIAARLETLRDIQETFWCKAWVLFLAGLLIVLPVACRYSLVGTVLAVGYLWGCKSVLGSFIQTGRELLRIDRDLMTAAEPRSAAFLLDSLANARGRHRREVISALTQMLPSLQDRDAGLFTQRQRDIMRMALLQGEDMELSLAILKAYERIGGRAERGLVRVLAEGVLTHTRDPRIQEAARECMPRLNARMHSIELDWDWNPTDNEEGQFAHPAQGMSGALSLSTLLPLDRGGH